MLHTVVISGEYVICSVVFGMFVLSGLSCWEGWETSGLCLDITTPVDTGGMCLCCCGVAKTGA